MNFVMAMNSWRFEKPPSSSNSIGGSVKGTPGWVDDGREQRSRRRTTQFGSVGLASEWFKTASLLQIPDRVHFRSLVWNDAEYLQQG